MRGWARTTLRAATWATAALLALAALLAALALAVSHGWQRDRVRAVLETTLGAALDAEVRIGALAGGLPKQVELRDVTLEKPGEPLLRIESLEAELDLSGLWRERRLRVESLRIVRPRLSVVREADGSWQVSGLLDYAPTTPSTSPTEPEPLTIELETLEVLDGALELTWHEGAAASRLSGRVELRAEDLRWPPQPSGPWPREASAELALGLSDWRGRSVASGGLCARLTGPAFRVESGFLAGPFGRVEFDAEGELNAASGATPLRRAQVRGRLIGFDLAPLGGAELASALDGTFSVGIAADPRGGMALDLGTRLGPSRLGDTHLASLELGGAYRTGTRAWRVERALLEAELGRIELAGRGTGPRIETLRLRAEGIDLGRIPSRWRPAGNWTGRIDGYAELEGPWPESTGPLEVYASGLGRDALDVGDLELRGAALGGQRLRIDRLSLDGDALTLANEGPALVRLSDGALELERLHLLWEGGALAVEGRIAANALDPLRVEVTSLDLESVAALAGIPTEVGGRVTARLLARGALRWPRLEGDALWEEARLGAATAERVDVELRSEGATLHASARLIDAGQERLRIEAALPYAESVLGDPRRLLEHPELALELRTEALDLAWAARAIPSEFLEAAGRIDGTIRLRGGEPQPDLTGNIELAEGAFSLPALGHRFGPAEGRLRLSGSSVEIESLRVQSGEGEGALSGSLTWSADGLDALDFAATFREFAASRTQTLTADVDGELRVAGPPTALRVAGVLTLREASLTLPESADPLLKEVRVLGLPEAEAPLEIREQPGQAPDLLRGGSADVLVTVPRNTWVRGRGAELEVEGELRVLKRPDEAATYVGSVQVVRGRYRFHGRTFDVERGVATFTGGTELDPELDFVATHRVRDVTLRALVSGAASAPRLTLESDPALDSTDMLSYLAFGRPAHELGSAESTRVEATATQLLGQLVAGNVASALAPALPLDLIQFDVTNGGTGANVEIGKYFTENVFVRYGRSFGTDESDRARVEWRFRPRWSLESELTTSGSSGADVIWSYDY